MISKRFFLPIRISSAWKMLIILMIISVQQLSAQQIIDEVLAVVGDELVLRSDLETQLLQSQETNPDARRDLRCNLMESMIQKKLLLARARADSLKVTEDQVENEMDRRLNYFINQIGSQEKLEQYYKKSIVEIKNDFRKSVKDQLLSDQMQGKVLGSVDITPGEVRKFFKGIPVDSLPDYNTEVEIAQIVIFPKTSREERQAAIEKLRGIRQDIVNGASFGTKALVYSQDNGSALKRGELGLAPASNYVPEFAAATLKLKKDSISDIIETKFGFHIIQLIERRGEMVNARHILIKPEIGEESRARARAFIDSLRTKIVSDTLKFKEAALKFSDDQDSRNRGGVFVDAKTNSSHVSVDDLDAITFAAIDRMTVGQVSEPLIFSTPDGRSGYRLLFLKSKTLPHKANFSDDYPKIRQIALEDKKQKMLELWFKKYLPLTYVRVDDKYKSCPNVETFIKLN